MPDPFQLHRDADRAFRLRVRADVRPLQACTTSPAFDTGAATHVGKVRAARTRTVYLARPDVGLWAVADGMGGHDAGDLASAAIIERFKRSSAAGVGRRACSPASAQSLVDANSAIRAIAKRQRGGALVGAIAVVLLASGRHFACVWSGDSRLYRVRAGAARAVTRDHTEVQDMVDQGLLSDDEARTWPAPQRHHPRDRRPRRSRLDMIQGDMLQAGDVFLLCSDGLTTHVADDEISARATAQAPQAPATRWSTSRSSAAAPTTSRW